MITKPVRILVPTDFSETATHALRYASDLARRTGARLTVVYADAFIPPVDYTATVGGWDEYSFVQLKARAEEQLKKDARANIDPSVPYDTVVRVAPPLEGILAQARESGAGMIVMGTHGRTGFRRLIIGSITEAVMRKAEVPVIAVPPGSDRKSTIRTIVCPAIYNDQCHDALAFAAAIAPADAKFVVIRATPADDIVETADDLFELRAWIPESIATRCELKMFGSGHVAGQIDGYAEKAEADLIVVGEPANRSASDLLYGTFAARVVQHSHCPVLTVNRPAARRAARISEQERKTDVVWANQ
jgi:nucleotide-binding universal stress UspA family protein